MIKKVIILAFVSGVICIVLFILKDYLEDNNRTQSLSLKEKIIQEEKGYIYNAFNSPNGSQLESIDNSNRFILRLQSMKKIEPPFILKYAGISMQKDNQEEYIGCTFVWYEEGHNTKGFRIKNSSQKIIKNVSFPKDFWNYNNTAPETEKLAISFGFKIIPGKETKWLRHNLLMTTVPPDVFVSPVYLTLYDSQGVECESVECERITKLSGKGSAVLTEPNLILWEMGEIQK
jgi:hypothetical protein